jgi:hypothetical protein
MRSPPRPHPTSLPGGGIVGADQQPPLLSPTGGATELFTFEVSMEIKEEDSKVYKQQKLIILIYLFKCMLAMINSLRMIGISVIL